MNADWYKTRIVTIRDRRHEPLRMCVITGAQLADLPTGVLHFVNDEHEHSLSSYVPVPGTFMDWGEHMTHATLEHAIDWAKEHEAGHPTHAAADHTHHDA